MDEAERLERRKTWRGRRRDDGLSRVDAQVGTVGWPKGQGREAAGISGRSVVDVVGQGLIEDEVWDRLGLGGIEFGGLVEEEVALWGASGR